jgi:L-alanine-DL-glutamate epimerase-like enolase superfamily enzyme
MALPARVRVSSWEVAPLGVDLREPFVIASGTVTSTRNALVRFELDDGEGRRATGLGEAATLVPVTDEDQPDALVNVAWIGASLLGCEFDLRGGFGELTEALDHAARGAMVSRAGAETALLDAIARLAGAPLREVLGGAVGAATRAMTTDITIPIRETARMVELAQEHRAKGFSCFKVKVGRDAAHDLEALVAIARAVPDARFRIDANAGYEAPQAIALVEKLAAERIAIECFEQPCAAWDLDGMAAVAAAIEPPVIADESVKHVNDVARLADARAADGVNLKLAKSGGPLAALAIGRAARAAGLRIMCGGMVETRLGMTAAAHVVAALGGVDFVDLDTAWLLAEDPFEGGYEASGPAYSLGDRPGLGVAPR